MVVETGVEALEGFRVTRPQDGSPDKREDLAAAGLLARTQGAFFPQATIAFPVISILHRPLAADGLREPGGASLLGFETGDEKAGLAFQLGAFLFGPLANTPDEMAGAGKGLMY